MKTEKLSYVIIPALVVVIGLTGFFISDGSNELNESNQIRDIDFYGARPDNWENIEDDLLNSLEGREEIDFVNELENAEALVYVHRYSTGVPPDSSAKEYIVLVSSVGADDSRTAVFRMSYENKEILDSHKETVPKSENLDVSDVIDTIENKASEHGFKSFENITENDIRKIGPNYIYTYPASDFGGTIIVNEYTGEPTFYATTIWMGTGQVITPEGLSKNTSKPGGDNIQPV